MSRKMFMRQKKDYVISGDKGGHVEGTIDMNKNKTVGIQESVIMVRGDASRHDD